MGVIRRKVGFIRPVLLPGMPEALNRFLRDITSGFNRLVETTDDELDAKERPVPIPFGRGALNTASKLYNLFAYNDGSNGVNQYPAFGRGVIVGASVRFTGGTVPAESTLEVKVRDKFHVLTIPSGKRNYRLRFEKRPQYDEDEDNLFEVLVRTGSGWGSNSRNVSCLLWVVPEVLS